MKDTIFSSSTKEGNVYELTKKLLLVFLPAFFIFLSNCSKQPGSQTTEDTTLSLTDPSGYYELKEGTVIQLSGATKYLHEFSMSDIVEDISYM